MLYENTALDPACVEAIIQLGGIEIPIYRKESVLKILTKHFLPHEYVLL